MLLIMGLGTQMLAWDEELCAMLAARGFRVDPLRQPRHRPLDDDRRGGDTRAALDMMRGRRDRAPYLLSDMADDASG